MALTRLFAYRGDQTMAELNLIRLNFSSFISLKLPSLLARMSL